MRPIAFLDPGAFTAIYPRECYATTNFLDPDFWGLSQKVTCARFPEGVGHRLSLEAKRLNWIDMAGS